MLPKIGDGSAIIEKLSPAHAGAVASFSCGSQDEDDFLKNDALANQSLGLSQTNLLFEKSSNKLVAYVTLSVGSFRLDSGEALGGVRIRDKQVHIFSNNMPCLFIGKLATDKDETGRGAASYLVNFAVSKALDVGKLIPVPFVALDAYADKVGFYQKLDFRQAFTPAKGSLTVALYLWIKNQ